MLTPLVLVIAMLKGGTGKTTSAVFIATWFALRHKKVLLLDCDPTSQSAHDWATLARQAGDELPFDVERYPFEDLPAHVAEMRQRYDVVIIDAGGGRPDLLGHAVGAADVVLATMAPTDADKRRLEGTVKVASEAATAAGRQVSLHVTLVRADKGTKQPATVHAELTAVGYPVTDVMISDLVRYSRAYGTTPQDLHEYNQLMVEMGFDDGD
jgi:chromosome partitioning protein